jgi:hypothetical protein
LHKCQNVVRGPHHDVGTVLQHFFILLDGQGLCTYCLLCLEHCFLDIIVDTSSRKASLIAPVRTPHFPHHHHASLCFFYQLLYIDLFNLLECNSSRAEIMVSFCSLSPRTVSATWASVTLLTGTLPLTKSNSSNHLSTAVCQAPR